MNPEFEAAAIVAAVSEDVEDAVYIVKWVIDSGDVHAMLHAIAAALVSSYDRVAHAIQDAINDSPLPPFDLVGMVKTLREDKKVKLQLCVKRFLARKKLAELKNDICAICVEPIFLGRHTTPCGHLFHTDCIRRWKAIKPECPMCRTGL
jgi:hypothetical protein